MIAASRLLALLLLTASLFARERHGGDFMRVDVGVAAIGRGQTGILATDPGTMAWWNPALLASDPQEGFAFQHSERFEGLLSQDFLAWNGRLGERPVGLYLLRQAVEDIPITSRLDGAPSLEEGGLPIISDLATASDWIVGAGIGNYISDKLAVGLSLKLIHRDLVTVSGWGLGLDAGLSYQALQSLRLAVAVRDVVSSVILWDDGESQVVLPEVAAGFYFAPAWKWAGTRITVAADLRSELEGESASADGDWRRFWIESGLGLHFGNLLELRAGWADDRPTAGAGLVLGRFTVDYAWRPHEDLGDSHLVSLGARIFR